MKFSCNTGFGLRHFFNIRPIFHLIEDFPLRTIKISSEIEYLTTILFFCCHLADSALPHYQKLIPYNSLFLAPFLAGDIMQVF